MEPVTVAGFIERAMTWESAARDYYLTFSSAFRSDSAVAEIWQQMADDESRHLSILTRTRDSLSDHRLAAPLDSRGVALVESVEAEFRRIRTAEVRTLDDAYEIAHGLESSEVNAVFELLVTLQAEDAGATALLEAQFGEHVGRLALLARRYDREARRRIAPEA